MQFRLSFLEFRHGQSFYEILHSPKACSMCTYNFPCGDAMSVGDRISQLFHGERVCNSYLILFTAELLTPTSFSLLNLSMNDTAKCYQDYNFATTRRRDIMAASLNYCTSNTRKTVKHYTGNLHVRSLPLACVGAVCFTTVMVSYRLMPFTRPIQYLETIMWHFSYHIPYQPETFWGQFANAIQPTKRPGL